MEEVDFKSAIKKHIEAIETINNQHFLDHWVKRNRKYNENQPGPINYIGKVTVSNGVAIYELVTNGGVTIWRHELW